MTYQWAQLGECIPHLYNIGSGNFVHPACGASGATLAMNRIFLDPVKFDPENFTALMCYDCFSLGLTEIPTYRDKDKAEAEGKRVEEDTVRDLRMSFDELGALGDQINTAVSNARVALHQLMAFLERKGKRPHDDTLEDVKFNISCGIGCLRDADDLLWYWQHQTDL